MHMIFRSSFLCNAKLTKMFHVDIYKFQVYCGHRTYRASWSLVKLSSSSLLEQMPKLSSSMRLGSLGQQTQMRCFHNRISMLRMIISRTNTTTHGMRMLTAVSIAFKVSEGFRKKSERSNRL